MSMQLLMPSRNTLETFCRKQLAVDDRPELLRCPVKYNTEHKDSKMKNTIYNENWH